MEHTKEKKIEMLVNKDYKKSQWKQFIIFT